MAFHKRIIAACLIIAIALNAALACAGVEQCGLWLPVEAIAAISGASTILVIAAIVLVLRASAGRTISPFVSGAGLIGAEPEKIRAGNRGKMRAEEKKASEDSGAAVKIGKPAEEGAKGGLGNDDAKDAELIITSLALHKDDYSPQDVRKEIIGKGYSAEVAEEVVRRLYGNA